MATRLALLTLLLTGALIVRPATAQTIDAPECHTRGGLPNVLAKWKAGQEVRVAYLGGSITAQEGWRPKTLAWFQSKFPAAKTTEINAAIGGTGSDLGVFRLQQDVLAHKPDLLFVEFAVNDGGAPPDQIRKAMDGIVRQTWRANPYTDICFVYTLAEGMLWELDAGKYPQAAATMEEVANHYGIPSIHMGVEVARLHREGKLIFTGPVPQNPAELAALNGKIVFSPDGVHPYLESGHELYFHCIQRNFVQIEENSPQPQPHQLLQPLVKDNWEQAKLVPLTTKMLSSGWVKLDPKTNAIAARFVPRLPDVWRASKPGESITLRFKGTSLLVYDLLGPNCGQINVQLDNQPAYAVPRFDAFTIYHRLATLPVANSVADGIHTVRLTILPTQPDKLAILHQRKENAAITTLDPKIYNGTGWYAGAILVIGDVLPE